MFSWWFIENNKKEHLNYPLLPPSLALWLTFNISSYPCLEQISIVPKRFGCMYAYVEKATRNIITVYKKQNKPRNRNSNATLKQSKDYWPTPVFTSAQPIPKHMIQCIKMCRGPDLSTVNIFRWTYMVLYHSHVRLGKCIGCQVWAIIDVLDFRYGIKYNRMLHRRHGGYGA